jgi:hypothetical protein
MTSAGEKERARLLEARESDVPWRKWGPYLSERQWGTVREDYSDSGDAWDYFTHNPRLVPALIAGEKTAWPGFPTTGSNSASQSHAGTAPIPSSRSVRSG